MIPRPVILSLAKKNIMHQSLGLQQLVRADPPEPSGDDVTPRGGDDYLLEIFHTLIGKQSG
jgi:hypothetical protein